MPAARLTLFADARSQVDGAKRLPPNGEIGGLRTRCRRLDGSGEYVVDADGNHLEVDSVDQAVAFYLATVFGSFIGAATIGSRATSVPVWDQRSEDAVRDAVKQALDPMLRDGRITDLAVVVDFDVSPSRAVSAYRVTYSKPLAVER